MQKNHGDEEIFRAVTLRPATSEDEPFLVELFASTRSNELALMNLDQNQKEVFIAMQLNAQTQQYVMSYPHADNRIILFNEASIGRFLVDRGESHCTLVDVALLPAHRGAGIGTYLIRNLLTEAAAAAKPVKLNVWHSNPAKRLYDRLGFSAAKNDDVYCEMWWNPGL